MPRKFLKSIRISIGFVLFCLIFPVATAKTLDIKDWYEYRGYSTLHGYAIKFPPDWQVRIIDDQIQGFAPKNKYNDPPSIIIQEFEGQTYNQIINYYTEDDVSFIESKDSLISTLDEDILAKKATFQQKSSGKSYDVTLFKRGSLIVSMVPKNFENSGIFEAMENSFYFTDEWHQYLDFNDNYSFIFPSSFELNILSNGVEIRDSKKTEAFFSILKYENTTLDTIKDKKEELAFHDYKGVRVTETDKTTSKHFNKIFVEKDDNIFSMTDVNVERDFPHPEYYGQFIQEMLESFEFFEIEIADNFHSYLVFNDVKNNHPNAKGINSLAKEKVINGYADGTFKPDGEINRAELTKMIVAAKTNPGLEQYHSCFPDVQKEWFAPYICYAKSNNWISGYGDGKFKPEASVSRVEAIKIILNGIFNGKINTKESLNDLTVADIQTSEWYGKYFIFADNRKLLDKQHVREEGNTYDYLPFGNISRKEVAEMIYRSKNLK